MVPMALTMLVTSVYSIIDGFFIGYNMGISQVIAYNYGAGNRQELRSLLKKSLVIVGLCGIAVTVLAEVGMPLAARIFVGYSESLSALTVHAGRVYMVSFLICGVNMFTSAWFTSLNNGMVSAVAAFVRTLVLELMAVNVAEFLALALSFALIAGFARRYGYNR